MTGNSINLSQSYEYFTRTIKTWTLTLDLSKCSQQRYLNAFKHVTHPVQKTIVNHTFWTARLYSSGPHCVVSADTAYEENISNVISLHILPRHDTHLWADTRQETMCVRRLYVCNCWYKMADTHSLNDVH